MAGPLWTSPSSISPQSKKGGPGRLNPRPNRTGAGAHRSQPTRRTMKTPNQKRDEISRLHKVVSESWAQIKLLREELANASKPARKQPSLQSEAMARLILLDGSTFRAAARAYGVSHLGVRNRLHAYCRRVNPSLYTSGLPKHKFTRYDGEERVGMKGRNHHWTGSESTQRGFSNE